MSCFVSTIKCTYGYVFKIVSNSHSIQDVSASLFSFIQTEMSTLLLAMSLPSFRSHVHALLDKYLMPNVDLHDEAKSMWDEIETARCDFELYTKKAACLRACCEEETSLRALLDELRSFCQHFFMNQTSCRMLCISSGHITATSSLSE